MSNSCESNGDHLDMRHYFLIVLLGEIFYGVVSGQIICDVDPNLNEKIFPQSIPEQNENQNPFHQYFSPVHVQADRSKRSPDPSDQRRPLSNSFRRHNPPVKSSGQSGSQLNDELQESSDYLQSNNNQNFLPPLNSVADINNNNEFQKSQTRLQTNNSSLSNSSVQSNTGDAQQQRSVQELKYPPVPLAKPPVSNRDFEFDNLDDDDVAQNIPVNGFNPRSNPDAGQTEIVGSKISSIRSGRKRRAPDVSRNPQTRRGGPGGNRNPNTNRGRPGNPNQNMNQRPNKNRNPNVRRPGENLHPNGKNPGRNPPPNGQKTGGNPLPNMQKPGGNQHPNMQTPGGNPRSNMQKPGGNPRSNVQKPRGNRPNMQTSGGNRPNMQKPGGNRPIQKPGGNRPIQKPGGNRPMQNPGKNRPMQKTGGNHPVQKPGGNRPMQKPGRNRPNIQKPGGNQNFKNGLNPPLQNNDDNGDYDDGESENQDTQPSSTVPSNSGEELSSDETSDTDDSQFSPDTSNDYPNTQLPEGFADDLLLDLDDSQSDDFLPTTESDDDSNQDSTPQTEETDEPQESSPDNSDSNTDTEPASSQTQPGPRRRPGSPSHRPGGPHRTRPPGVTRNPQMRKRKPGVTRNPKVTRPGRGGNSQNGLGPPTQGNNEDNDGDSSKPPEEPSKDDTNDQFSTQPLDGISSDFGDEDYSLSTPEIEDQVGDRHPNTKATALTDDPQIPPGVPDDFPGYKFPDGFISDLLSDLDTTSSTEKHHSNDGHHSKDEHHLKDEHHPNDEHHSKHGMKQPRRQPYGGMRNNAGSLHNHMYPKRRRQNFKRVRIPPNISNLKQQPNHFKQSGDVPPTIDKYLDKSEPEQHFSEIEQDNTPLQDNTYPSDFEVMTPANDYDIPQYDNLDDYASHDVQPIPSNDKFAEFSPHVKRNRNLSRPKQHRTTGLRISRPLEPSTSESETDKATEEDFPPAIDESFDVSAPKQHFYEIEQDSTSSQDDIYPSDFEIPTPENDYDSPQLNTFEDYSSQDDQPIPNNAKFAELPPHMKRNRNRSRPKQHRTKGSRILRPLESSTSESEIDAVTVEDLPPTIETEENNAYPQDDTYPTDFEITTLANDYDSPQLNNFEDYTSQDDRPIPNSSKFAEFPPHVKRNRNQFRPKQHRTKGSRISPPLKSSTSESDIDTTTEDDYSSQYPLKQKSVKVTGPGEIYSLPYDEWWKHLHTIKSPDPEESTEELTQQSTEQYTDNPTEDVFFNQDSPQQTGASQDDGSILVPSPESHRITPEEKSTSSNFRQPQTAPRAENDRLKRPHQRRRRPLQPNLRNKDANNKYRENTQRGKRPLNFSDRFKNFGTQQLPDKIDTTTEDQSLYKNFSRTFNENNDTAENGDIAVSNDEDTTLYESSTSYQLPSQKESHVFTPKSFVTKNEHREKLRRKHPKLNRFPDGGTKLTRRPHPTEADIEAARKRLRQKFTDVLADDDDTTISTENNGYNSSPETLLTQTDDNLTPENYLPQTEPFNSWKRTPPHFRRRLHPSSIDFADVTTEQQTFQQESSDEQSNTDGTSPSSSDYEYEFPTPSELNYDNDDSTILINNYEYESTTVSKEDDKYESTTSLKNNYDYEFSSNPSLLPTNYEFTSIPSLLQTNYEFPSNPSLLNIDYEYSTLEHTSPENILDPSKRKKLPHTKFGFLNSGENIGTHTSPADFTKDGETEPQDYQEEIINTESTILNIASSENSEIEFTTGFPDGTTATEIYSTIKISPSDLTYNSDEFSGTELLTKDVSTTTIANLDEDSSSTDSATESGSTMEITKNSLKPFRIKDANHPDMKRKRRKKIKGKNITRPPYPMENRRRKPKIPTGIPNDFPNFSFPDDFFSDMLSGLTETPSTEDSNVSKETPSTENAEINTETPCTEDAVINTESPSTKQTEINTEITSTRDEEINTEAPNTGDEEIITETPSSGDEEIHTETLNRGDEEINTEAPSSGDEEIHTETPNTGDEEINPETPSTGDEEINTETPSTGDAELNTETPSKGDEEINRETSNKERITHIKPKKRGKKKKAKKSKIHRPKESSGKTEETSNDERSTVTYSGTKEKESSTIFMTEPVTTPVTKLDTTLVSSSALPTTWPPDITSISESIITSESPIMIMTTETTDTITAVSDLSAQISLSTTEASITASKVPTTTTEVSTSTTEVPTSTTEVPTSTTEVPTSTTEAPTSTTEAPTSTTEAPTSTTEVPTSTTEAPATSEETPVITIEPSTTTEIPSTTTEIPATTTEIPSTTTEIPSTTTEIPSTTTKIPSTTTEIPSTTTEIPSTTTEIPSTASNTPSTTTKVLITEMPTTTTETFTTEVPSSVSEVPSSATEIPKATSEIPTRISKLSTTSSDISTKITQVSKITPEIPNLSTRLSTTTLEDLSLTTKIPSTVPETLAETTKTPITTIETPNASKETVPTITEIPITTSKSSIIVTKISTDTPTVMTEALTMVSEIPKTTTEILRTSEVSTTSEKISTFTTPESIELITIPATSIPIATSSDVSISATEFTSTITSIPTEITEQSAASPSTPTVQITTETEQLSTSELLISSSSQISTSSTSNETSSPDSAILEATDSPDSTNIQPSISQSSTSLESVTSPSSQEPVFTTETSASMDATPRSIATKSVSTIKTSVPSLTISTPMITTPIPSSESTFTTGMESSSARKTSDITEEFGSSSDIVTATSTASSVVTEISATPAMNESTTLIGTTTEKFHASPLNNYTTIEPPAGVQCYENESYYACVPHCQHTCFNYDSDEPCPDFCEPGCGCNKGLLIDEKGRCVPPEDCFELTCGLDEEWWDCKPKCHNTCPNFARAEACEDHPTDCEPGCYCRDGLILDVDGSCVEPEDCDDPVCDGEIEEETDCMDQCNTCAMICHTCKMTMCRPGCDCKDGYKRDINGTCIHVTECPLCPLPSTTISV